MIFMAIHASWIHWFVPIMSEDVAVTLSHCNLLLLVSCTICEAAVVRLGERRDFLNKKLKTGP
jgi:hypothetical protein